MSKFSMYVIDLEEKTIEGTNDVEQVEHLLDSEFEDRFIILHGQHGVYFNGSRQENEVHPMPDSIELEVGEDEIEGTGDPE